mmetsp:Transcript_48745/g.137163  ORF Transcript_48745/g.137163 Transcript_48745/m.137163 type:complete len:392 (+) Transcript_48745:260-1435(+)
MSASLISEDNLCGKTLLHMSASGSSIIAELLRLKDNIPEVFSDSDESQEKKYVPVLIDFAYLKRGEEFERKLNASTGMLDLDQEFFDNYQPILMRFYTLFESIVKYLSDYLDFLDKLQSGIFIQYTTDIVLQDVDGKQLMCECLYLYGAMLLLLERHMPGPMREKIVIAVMRHQGEMSLEHHEDVCKLIRSTGYDPNSTDKHPKNYPENFFSRFAIPSNIVRLLVQTLQSDDIYRVARSFPSPEHRSVRLANQAGMLYVILYFAPELLHKSDTAMRETVDRHFGENWIITIYMGHVIDLSHEWARYKVSYKFVSAHTTPPGPFLNPIPQPGRQKSPRQYPDPVEYYEHLEAKPHLVPGSQARARAVPNGGNSYARVLAQKHRSAAAVHAEE